ncbi:hypothetical protein VNO78_18405 [Psophocarpus tetragonolobus]|uniref:Glutathione synthetase n=1 Tax=Psophocarpus tetragonolobus TaxID=3891 RepID=A0AAN9SPG1_PSOTE
MSQPLTLSSAVVQEAEDDSSPKPSLFDYHSIDQKLLQNIVYDSLVWSTLNCLLVGDKSVQRSGTVPGVGLVHLPLSLLPGPFPESHWKQACELAPIFNELVDRVSLDGQFLQESLSRTKKADEFTSRLLDIHAKMLQINKKEDIRMGIVRSDYMIDEKTKSLLQIEMNTISTSFALIGCLMTGLHRSLLSQYGKFLGLDSNRVPANNAVDQSAEALAKAWSEFNNPRAAILVVVQVEERNMDGQAISIVYFRAGYTPKDYPSESVSYMNSEWRARLMMEQSSAIKCPTISYHLVGTKKVQQELAKPGVLERTPFIRESGKAWDHGDFDETVEGLGSGVISYSSLWSLEDSDIVKKAIESPELFVMKPQREGGGNNIYGDDLRKTLLKLQEAGSEEDAAYILMQRIFPATYPAILVRDGNWNTGHVIAEAGIFGTYLRNKDKIIINNESGYMVRTKVSTSYEGGVLPGFGVVDTVYLT